MGGSSGCQRVLDTTCWQGIRKRLWTHWSGLPLRTEHPCHWENWLPPDRCGVHLQKLNALCTLSTLYHTAICVLRVFFMAVFFIFFNRKIVGRFETYFHLTSAGPQSCCGLFGKLAIDNVFLFLENLAFSLSSDLPKANQHELICVCSCRFANAFSYYGLVLLTTELFQEGGACGSESDAEGFTHFMVVMFLQKASQTVGWVLDLKHPVWCNSL